MARRAERAGTISHVMSDRWYRALASRDARFDGVFFVGVTTTGIYCRPICTARLPGRPRCLFFNSRVEAEGAGFRACFRCRPELAPGHASVDAVPRLVDRAVRRIESGALNEASVDDLADELGVTGRHLRRTMVEVLGVSPVELAQSTRLAFAKRLIQDTSLPLTELALASGFQSVRRFNSAFRAQLGRAPSTVRKEKRAPSSEVQLRLDYRPPLSFETMLKFLEYRSILGTERVVEGAYHRTIRMDGKVGWVSVRSENERLIAFVSVSLVGSLMGLVAKLRALFDLDAKPTEIDSCLEKSPRLRERVKRQPGLRVPGAVDGFELGVRAVLGQQVSVKGAATLAARMVQRFGEKIENAPVGLTHVFPKAETIAEASLEDIAAIGMPRSRALTLKRLASEMASGLKLEPGVPLEPTLTRLMDVPGIGEWTAQYLAMRALSWPDAFPASDLGVLKGLGVRKASESLKIAEAFRPWRAYATLHLWSPQ